MFGMTHKEAAAYIDVPATTVSSLMQRRDVKEYIAELQAAQAKKLNVTREHVIEGYLKAIDHARMVNEPGTELRGWELIAKLQGYNAPEKHIHDLPEDTKKLLEHYQNADDRQLAEIAGQQGLLELTQDDYAEVPGGD